MTSTVKVLIFGKDTCPYTLMAREDYTTNNIPFDYINVKASDENMQQMLKYSKGSRKVPVIVEGEKVKIGYGGT